MLESLSFQNQRWKPQTFQNKLLKPYSCSLNLSCLLWWLTQEKKAAEVQAILKTFRLRMLTLGKLWNEPLTANRHRTSVPLFDGNCRPVHNHQLGLEKRENGTENLRDDGKEFQNHKKELIDTKERVPWGQPRLTKRNKGKGNQGWSNLHHSP